MKSSPGYPYMRLGRTNGELLAVHSGLVSQLATARLTAMATTPLELLRSYTAAELVEFGFCDPVRVFVKNELHSESKVLEGRFRLIMSVSIVDQIVERVLNGRQNNLEIESWQTIFSKPGMGLDDDGLKSLEDQIARMANPLSSDISGFDWSVSQEWLDLDARCRAILTGDRLEMHLKRSCCLGYSLFVLSDGTLLAQEGWRGVQKSGSYNTSSTNSRIRAMLALLVGSWRGYQADVIAMGDDAVEDSPDDDLATSYLQLGFRLKEQSRDIEFCAYGYDLHGGYRPVRWHKMLASMLWTKPRDELHKQELLVALAHELRHSPHRDRAMQAVAAVGWGGGN